MADDQLTPEQTAAVAAVRLLANDPANTAGTVFSDDEYVAFLGMERGVVKLAAAQAIDTIADNEALVAKVIRDGELATDGAKLADSLRKRAASLRAQAASEKADDDAGADDGGAYFGLTNIGQDAVRRPELTAWPTGPHAPWGW